MFAGGEPQAAPRIAPTHPKKALSNDKQRHATNQSMEHEWIMELKAHIVLLKMVKL